MGEPMSTRFRPVVVSTAVFVVTLSALVTLSWDDVTETRHEDGDFAANSILIDSAMSLDLVHGNYSRAVFYHPGPAFLYVQATGQALLFEGLGVVPTPYNAHLLAAFVLNALLLGLSAGIAFRETDSVWAPLLLVFIAFAYSLEFAGPGLGGLLSATWMPHLYVWPFLLMLVSSASVGAGRGEDIWKLALAGSLLIHGHISFVLPVAVFLLVVTVTWIRSHRSEVLAAIPKSSRIATLIIITAALVPIVAHVIVDFPGEVDDYLDYLGTSTLPPRNILDVADFVADYWALGTLAAVLVPLLGIVGFAGAISATPTPKKRFLTALMLACTLATLTTAFYAYSGVDDLSLSYLALFYVAVPILVWTVIGSTAVERLTTGRPGLTWALAAALAISWLMVLAQPDSGSTYNGSQADEAFDSIEALVGPDDKIVISFEHDRWPATAGVLEQARRAGQPVCLRTEIPVFEILFTAQSICESQTDRDVELAITDEPPTPNAIVVFETDSFRIWATGG